MNKKGFTLVELLAVIAILAILVIIALPNVLSMFNQAKKDTFATETKEMVKIAQQQYLADFGKNTRYAYSKENKNMAGTAITTVDCAAVALTDGNYCKINKEAGNLSIFIIEFNAADGQVKSIEAFDGTYKYVKSFTTDNPYDATQVVAQEDGE